MISSLPSGPLTTFVWPTRLDDLRVAQHLARDEVDLGYGAGKLAREDDELAVDREIRVIDPGAARNGDRILQRHRLRVAEVQALHGFGHHDRRLPVGREVHVVGIVDGDRLPRLSRHRIDRRHAATRRVLGVVRHPQRAQVPRRNDVLRVEADFELADDRERGRVDDVDIVGLDVRHIDARQVAGQRGAHLARRGFAVEIGCVRDRRHARNGDDSGRRRGLCGREGDDRHATQQEHDGNRDAGATTGRLFTYIFPGVSGTLECSDGRRFRQSQRRAVAFLIAATVAATMMSTPACPASAVARRGSP